jgi:hypothetical protein
VSEESEGVVLRVVTVNAAVEDTDAVVRELRAIGFPVARPARFPGPPGYIVDTTVGLGAGHVSLVTPLSEKSPIRRFLEKKGEGYASITIEVDDLDRVMERWSAAGVQWWQPEPHEFHDVDFGDVHADLARVNWTKTSSLGGLAFEVVEFRGAVRPREDWDYEAAAAGGADH